MTVHRLPNSLIALLIGAELAWGQRFGFRQATVGLVKDGRRHDHGVTFWDVLKSMQHVRSKDMKDRVHNCGAPILVSLDDQELWCPEHGKITKGNFWGWYVFRDGTQGPEISFKHNRVVVP